MKLFSEWTNDLTYYKKLNDLRDKAIEAGDFNKDDHDALKKGHGVLIGSCGHTLRQCRCIHGGKLKLHIDLKCTKCLGINENKFVNF